MKVVLREVDSGRIALISGKNLNPLGDAIQFENDLFVGCAFKGASSLLFDIVAS